MVSRYWFPASTIMLIAINVHNELRRMTLGGLGRRLVGGVHARTH